MAENEVPVTTTTPTITETAPVTQSVETAPVVTETQTETPVQSVLTEALNKTSEPPKTETTTVEPPKTVEQTTEPVKTETTEPKTEGQSEEPAPPPVYDPFKIPEGIQLDQERVKQFTDILSELEMSKKVDHAAMQEFGQKAVDFHLAEIQKSVETLQKYYVDIWEKQKNTWKDEFLKDPEIGGNRMQTTVDSALNFIRTHGGTPEQQAELRGLFDSSGLGNHKALIRLFANAGKTMSEGKPLAAQTPVTAPKSVLEKMYGKKS